VDENVDRRIDRFEVVEFVLAVPAIGESLSGWVALVEHTERGFANVGVVRMAVEIRAGESAVPRPVVFSVRGGVDADVSAARLDVELEVVLLCVVQHVARCVQEDDSAVEWDVLRCYGGGVYGSCGG